MIETTEERLLYFGVSAPGDPGNGAPIHVVVKLPENDDGPPFERPLAKPLGNGRFSLANVPYFAKDIALHDVVALDRDEDCALPHVVDVVERSGYRTIHIDVSEHALDQPTVLDMLEGRECAIELSHSRSSDRVRIAVSVPPTCDVEEIARALQEAFGVEPG